MGKVQEVERAFLPNQLPAGLKDVKPAKIIDIYLSPAEDLLNKIRLRQNGDWYELTKKVVVDPKELSVQDEYNMPLTKDEFLLLGRLRGRIVEKDRYKIIIDGTQAEIDVFKGPLNGFVLVEFEFASEKMRDAFVIPEFCIADVTQEDFIAGAHLAGRSYKDVAPDLERFGYHPI